LRFWRKQEAQEMRKLGCIVIALLAVVIVVGCTATIVQRNNTRKAVGQSADALENIEKSAQDIADALEDVEDQLEEGPVGTFFEEIDSRGQ
jgi:peptidoglycan hydrolase CwlO-like protein